MEHVEVITISQFKATCLAVLDKVKRTGQSVLITRRGETIAMIEPPPPPEIKESWLGSFRSSGRIEGDILSPVIEEEQWKAMRE